MRRERIIWKEEGIIHVIRRERTSQEYKGRREEYEGRREGAGKNEG